MLARLREGLTIATKAGTIGRALVLTLLAWGCTILAFTAGAQAVGIQPTMGQAALLAAGTNLATAIPAAPGYVGTFELAAVTIGASVGISRDDALAMAVLVHGFSLLITSIGGAIAFALGPRRRHAGTPRRPCPGRAGRRRRGSCRRGRDRHPRLRGRTRESRRPRADPGPSSVVRGTRYLSSAFSVRNALATSASAFLSTATLTPSSVSVSVVSSAETLSRSAWKAFASPTFAR